MASRSETPPKTQNYAEILVRQVPRRQQQQPLRTLKNGARLLDPLEEFG